MILSGPSGVGKDTVLEAWTRLNPRVRRVVAYTTRPPRPGERDGVDYNFVPIGRFEEMAARGDFLEHKEVHGNFYATPLRDMEAMLEEGLIAVLKIDVQGALVAMGARPDALSVFVLPPSERELERRIRARGSDSEADIELRLSHARAEMELASRYRHRVVNVDSAKTARELDALVGAGCG